MCTGVLPLLRAMEHPTRRQWAGQPSSLPSILLAAAAPTNRRKCLQSHPLASSVKQAGEEHETPGQLDVSTPVASVKGI